MSASTVSISANPSATTRRRPVEKKTTDAPEPSNFNGAVSPASEKLTVSVDGAIRTEGLVTARDPVVLVRKPLPSSSATARRPTTAQPRKSSSKHAKPWWMTLVSVLTKNLLLIAVLLGLFQYARKIMIANDQTAGVDLVPGDSKGNLEQVEGFIVATKKAMKMMQMQVDVLDRKIGDEIDTVKKEVGERIEAQSVEFEAKLKELDGRTVNLESFMDDLKSNMEEWLSKEEMKEFTEEVKKTKSGDAVSLDEIRMFARGIVEKEIQKHAADGIGRVDYALATAGASVVKHSEPYAAGGLLQWARKKVSPDAEKMLRPSFGEPGQCFPLKGSSGFVLIKLRNIIIPEAVTLEHVSEAVAYDRSSAPKDCRVSGWLDQDSSEPLVNAEEMLLLTEFTYDLEKRDIQTFDVLGSASAVNRILLEFTSNHGNHNHTCIYRLRVHGTQPQSVSLF